MAVPTQGVENRRGGPADRILDAVVELLETQDFDGWSLAAVARTARVSLRDVYKFSPSDGDLRTSLIFAAIARWMDLNTCAEMSVPSGVSLRAGLAWCFRQLLEPWEKHPQLLAAYQRVRLGPAGRQLDQRGLAAFQAAFRTLVVDLDPSYADDLSTTLASVTSGLIAQAVRGEIPVTEVLPTLERAIALVTSDNAALARGSRVRSGSLPAAVDGRPPS